MSDGNAYLWIALLAKTVTGFYKLFSSFLLHNLYSKTNYVCSIN